MSGSARKRFWEALSSTDWTGALEGLGKAVSRGLVSQAVAALCSQEQETRWRAVEAVGFLASKLAQQDREAARDVVRRLLWSLNEESGSIGWGVPEALAEILAREKELAREFLPIFISFLDPSHLAGVPPVIAQGFLWGVFRLGELYKDLLGNPEILKTIGTFLASPDACSRGMAVLALKKLQALEAFPEMHSFAHDPEFFTFMEGGELQSKSISKLLQP